MPLSSSPSPPIFLVPALLPSPPVTPHATSDLWPSPSPPPHLCLCCIPPCAQPPDAAFMAAVFPSATACTSGSPHISGGREAGWTGRKENSLRHEALQLPLSSTLFAWPLPLPSCACLVFPSALPKFLPLFPIPGLIIIVHCPFMHVIISCLILHAVVHVPLTTPTYLICTAVCLHFHLTPVPLCPHENSFVPLLCVTLTALEGRRGTGNGRACYPKPLPQPVGHCLLPAHLQLEEEAGRGQGEAGRQPHCVVRQWKGGRPGAPFQLALYVCLLCTWPSSFFMPDPHILCIYH